ncbi:MAG: serine--tRNA ligase, partial [Verrucomicrobiota bacterium]
MLDIREVRDNPELVKQRVKTRGGDAYQLIDEILDCDVKRRESETEKQSLQGDRKRISKEIGALKKAGEDSSEIEAKVRTIGDRIKEIGEIAETADNRQSELLLQVPNLPHPDCPVGEDEDDNPEIRTWGEQPKFDFDPLDHVALGENLNLFSFELGARVSGSGFITFTGQGARLQRALIQFLLDQHTENHGYQEVLPPFVINRDSMFGTGQLPKFEDDMYGLEDGAFFLAPTAEVPVTNLYREQLITEEEMPVKMTA